MAKKKNEEKKFTVKDSMIFERSDRKKADEQGTAAKKSKALPIALAISLAVVILFVGVPWLVVTIIKSSNSDIVNDGKPKFTYEQMVEKTTPTEAATQLFNMKNPDLTDQQAVEKMIRYLGIENELGKFTVEVRCTEKPYTIILTFEDAHKTVEAGEVDAWTNRVASYASAILALTDDVAQVRWLSPNESGLLDGAGFTRDDAKDFFNLGVPAIKFAESPTTVQAMLNMLGIDIY